MTTFRMYTALLVVGALLLTACASDEKPTVAGSSAPGGTGASGPCTEPSALSGTTYLTSMCKVPAPSLDGNLLGDPSEVESFILTPANGGTDARRPVIYILAGYFEGGMNIADSLSRAAAAAPPAVDPILVVANGLNAFDGSFYANSTVAGGWEDAIAVDLVGYVDKNYPTIARREARGIAGHSMGGSGALNIAMNRADVFGAVYAMSPGLFDAEGAEARLAIPTVVDRVLEIQDEIAGQEQKAALDHILASVSGEDVTFEWAYGVAYAPDPASPSLMKFPFTRQGGKIARDDAVWAVWEAGFGAVPAKLKQHADALRSLAGIGVDWGTNDEYGWIPDGCEYFVAQLTAGGFSVTEARFSGGHMEQLGDRLLNHMLPFMSTHLKAS